MVNILFKGTIIGFSPSINQLEEKNTATLYLFTPLLTHVSLRFAFTFFSEVNLLLYRLHQHVQRVNKSLKQHHKEPRLGLISSFHPMDVQELETFSVHARKS